MKKLTTNELRKTYLDFFVSKAHSFVKSDSLVPANDPSVLFTSAGMNQFKNNFLGKDKTYTKATSCQKCFRTGDLEQVGMTAFHHTFFEMLGNFSFGDYFKKDAIKWAWEFVTAVLEIDKRKLWVSVYQDDDEALNIWKQDIGLPLEKIKKLGAKDNFWPSNAILDGPNGPCGPCSEIYYEKENGESVELWNLVFTQFNRCDGGVLEPLPNKNIDTGMGLERMSSVLQSVYSNFDTDIFVPIIEAVKKEVEIIDIKIVNPARELCGTQREFSNRVNMIADHVRAVSFCICDGVLPSNDGRGYVVRKLIRRASYLAQGKNPKPFLYKIVQAVASVMSEPYPEILERRDNIAQIINAEEEKYIKNILEGGADRLNVVIESLKKSGKNELPAEIGLDLYVTYGIQPDFTKELCDKEGILLDIEKIDSLIEQEQDKSRSSSKMAGSIFSANTVQLKESEFVGYEADSCRAKVIQIINDGKGIVLDKTPFYGEGGGQVGDKGVICVEGKNIKLKVIDTKKENKSVVHLIEAVETDSIKVGDEVEALVDLANRQAIKRAHTATHILQAVLRKALGPHVQQAGSYVEPDRFRFDFTHFKDIGDEEMEKIQEFLNDFVIKNDSLTAKIMPKTEAQKTGATALFGEKYEDEVRVVSIADYSKEFCGGTHLDWTGKIGAILITSESSVGSGLRRIEALTGKLAYKKFMDYKEILEDISAKFKVVPEKIIPELDKRESEGKAIEKENLRLREAELEKEAEELVKHIKQVNGISYIWHKFKSCEVSLLRKASDILKQKIQSNGVFFLCEQGGNFVCGVTQDLFGKNIDANGVIKHISALVGGSGGGRKDFAQGGTKEVGKLDLSKQEIEKLLKGVV